MSRQIDPAELKAADGVKITLTKLAVLLQLSERHIFNLSTQGHIPKPVGGKVSLFEALLAFIEYQRRDSDELGAERLRKTTEEADKLALENEKTRGKLVEIEAVYKHFESLFIALRARILASALEDHEKDELLNDLRGIKSHDLSEPGGLGPDNAPAAGNPDPAATLQRS